MATTIAKDRPVCMSTIDLNDGNKIPLIGLGVMEKGVIFEEKEIPRIIDSVVHAIHSGYRLFDTAHIYNTEAILGKAIRASGVPRSEITVVTKLTERMHHDPRAALQESLRQLDLEYVDIYLMHWPCASTSDGERHLSFEESPTYIETWKMMEDLVGPTCRSIGVSNFTQKTLEALMTETKMVPVVNQIELHPLNPCLKLVPWCQEHGIQVEAWGPLGGGPTSLYTNVSAMYNHPLMTSLASGYDVSVGVIILSWMVQRGIVVIPHSSSPKRLDENIRTVKLTAQEIEKINNMHREIGQLRLIDHVDRLWHDDAVPGKGRTFLGWTPQEIGWVDEKGTWLT